MALAVLLFAGCGSIAREEPRAIRGRLVLETVPAPLVARALGEDVYEVAFDIVMREEGGVDTRIVDFTVDAIALGGIIVRSETHPAAFIESRGFPSRVGAGEYLRFSFRKQWRLPSQLLLSGAALRVTARTVDANGARDESTFRTEVVTR